MRRVTESIYTGKTVIIPLADVQHIERHALGIQVITKHTRWDCDYDFWANPIWIAADEHADFIAAWRRYRNELETDTLADLTPHAPRDYRSEMDKIWSAPTSGEAGREGT